MRVREGECDEGDGVTDNDSDVYDDDSEANFPERVKQQQKYY